jgi:hypothetical protein
VADWLTRRVASAGVVGRHDGKDVLSNG